MSRISIDQYAISLAHVVALRSQDPKRKVGAVALDSSNRIIATGYNGLAPGIELTEGEWEDDDVRLAHILHAEQNLVSLFRRGEVETVAVTCAPCSSCARLLMAHGVRRLIFTDEYERDPGGLRYLLENGVHCVCAPRETLTFIFEAALAGVGYRPSGGPEEGRQVLVPPSIRDPLAGAVCEHGYLPGICSVCDPSLADKIRQP